MDRLVAETHGNPLAIPEALENDGLVEFGDRVIFRHPLIRAAVYNAATPRGRREAHRALAEASDRNSDPDRRAWHRARATVRPDEAVAAELEASAGRAQSRGGFAAAGAFLERSAALTTDPGRRAVRALRAAQANRLAGALDAASGLAVIAERGPLGHLERAQLDALLGQIAFARSRGNEAPPLLLRAASRLEQVDLRLASDAYLEALTAALFAGRLARETDLQAVAKAARARPTSDRPPRASDLLLEGLALLITDGYKPGVTVLKKVLSAFRYEDPSPEERLRWSWLAGGTAGFIWDHDTWDVLTARQERLARELGALSVLPTVLSTRVGVSLFTGDMASARSLVDQVQIGDAGDARQQIAAITRDSQTRGEGLAVTVPLWAKAVLCNGSGLYEEAFHAAAEAVRDPNDLWYWGWSAVELIEVSAVRTGPSGRGPHWSSWLRAPRQAELSGLLRFKPGAGRFSLTVRKRRIFTGRRLSGCCRPGCNSTLPALVCCMASGCAGTSDSETLVISCAAPMGCSSTLK